MNRQPITFSPMVLARTGGALYLVLIVLGIYAQIFVRDALVVPRDDAATAARILANIGVWRLGIVAEYLASFCTLGLAMAYYFLMRPVSRHLTLLATLGRAVAITVQAVAVVFLICALFPLGTSASMQAIAPELRYAMTGLAIRAHSYGYGVALLFTGGIFLVHGLLVRRSGFLPPILGTLIQIAGAAYAINSLTMVLRPELAPKIFPVLALAPFIAETSLSLWLLVRGVDVPRWMALAAADGQSRDMPSTSFHR